MKTVKRSNTNLSSKKVAAMLVLFLGMTNYFFVPELSATPLTGMVKMDTRIYSSSNIMIDATVVVFDVAYSNAVDWDDAPKMSNSGENIAIQRGTSVLVIEGRQPPVANDLVPFRIWNLRQQNYRLEIVSTNMTTPGLTAWLEDAYLNTSTIINPVGITSVNFTVNSNAGSSAGNRFRIIFKQGTPLPVTFISISANKTPGGVKVDWKVAAERNISSYELQRSADGSNFSSVGIIAASGNNSVDLNYSLYDATATYNVVFYRIRSVETDGESKYSSIVKVNAADAKQGFGIVSNPVENGMINIQFVNQQAGKYNLRVVNNTGQNIMIGNVNHAGGSSNQLLNLPGTMAGGIYHLLIITPGNDRVSQTVIVNNR